MSSGDQEDLPRTNVRRIVKNKLTEMQKTSTAAVSINKEALLAFSESAKIFIHYISAAANEICREGKRQTISADDVLKALDELEFNEFLEPLTSILEDIRKESQIKKTEAKRKSQGKKRKAEEDAAGVAELTAEGGAREADIGEDAEEPSPGKVDTGVVGTDVLQTEAAGEGRIQVNGVTGSKSLESILFVEEPG